MPLARGYSRETISRNIGKLTREGYSTDRAAAIAYSEARRWFAHHNPGARLPEYLRPYLINARRGKTRNLQGKRLYAGFMGRPVSRSRTVNVRPLPKEALDIGQVAGIIYATTRGGKMQLYRHDFKLHARPLLAVSVDGRQLILLGGAYRFTNRGIVDDPR